MADSLTRLPGKLLQRLFRAAFPVVRKLYYDIANQFGFGDLYIHEMMLADRVRVDAYNDAIKQHVRAGDVVVDLGTGSGILAFLAAAQKPRKVYAIDHSSITELASMVMEDNGIDNVEILKVNSRKLRLPEKVDVIIHEQMGHALFDERMVLNVTDLRDRVLKPGGKILPARFELFLDPVQVKDDHFVPFAWEQTIHGVRFVALRRLKGSMAPDYLFKELHQWEYSRFLCDSVPVLSFDLTTLAVADLPSAFELSRTVTTAGRLDGLAVHFVARFDDEISISTSPFSPRTCWRVPLLRTESRAYEVGQTVAVKVAAPDLSNLRTWTWSVSGNSAPPLR